MLGSEIIHLAVLLIRLVADIAVENAVTNETPTHTVALGLLAEEVLRIDAILASLALEIVRRAFFFDVYGCPRK